MDISTAEAYIAKAKSYGKNLLILGRKIPDQLVACANNAHHLRVKVLPVVDGNVSAAVNKHIHNDLVWAHTVICVECDTVSLTTDQVVCMLSTTEINTHTPYEIYQDGDWIRREFSRPANQYETLSLWKDFTNIWPSVVSDHKEKVALLDAGATMETSFMGYTMSTVIDLARAAKLQGATKFVFCNIQETLQLHNLLKAQHFAEIMRDEIGIQNVAMATSAMHAHSAWQKYANHNGIREPITVISGNWYDLPWRPQYVAFCGDYEVPEFDPMRVPEKLFLSLNNCVRWHRTQLGVMLEHNKLIDKGYYSLRNLNEHDVNALKMDKKYSDAKESLSKRVPIHLDDLDVRENHMAFTQTSDIELHQNSAVSLVTETIYQSHDFPLRDGGTEYVPNCVFYTEKTYKPIWFYQPFIAVAVPGFLRAMRELGWLTFHPYIDESYDDEKDDDKRMEMIVAELTRLSKFTDDEWREFRQGVLNAIQLNGDRIRRLHPGILASSPFEAFFPQ